MDLNPQINPFFRTLSIHLGCALFLDLWKMVGNPNYIRDDKDSFKSSQFTNAMATSVQIIFPTEAPKKKIYMQW